MDNRKKYILFSILGFIVMIVPVLIYNLCNWNAFVDITATKFTFTFLIALSMLGLAALTKTKKKTFVWLMVIGVMLAIFGTAGVQIGCSLLIIGSSMIIDQFVLNKLALKYKEAWYNESGRTITYTRNIE